MHAPFHWGKIINHNQLTRNQPPSVMGLHLLHKVWPFYHNAPIRSSADYVHRTSTHHGTKQRPDVHLVADQLDHIPSLTSRTSSPSLWTRPVEIHCDGTQPHHLTCDHQQIDLSDF